MMEAGIMGAERIHQREPLDNTALQGHGGKAEVATLVSGIHL